jgi:multiple sugar transport system permease protein
MVTKRFNITPYLLILPTYLLFLFFFLLPVFQSFVLSFYKWNGFSLERKFIGFSNYTRLFHDADFWNAAKNTLAYTIGTVPLSILAGLLLAILLSGNLKGVSLFRSIYFMPTIISMVAISVVWNWIYSPDSSGLANAFLKTLGFSKQSWLSDPKTALPALMIMGVWKNFGYGMVILLAGLKSIPTSLYEAASLDGADRWRQFKNVTFPLLRPTVAFLAIILTIQSFQVFDQVNIMTQGGPVGSTEVIVSYLYKLGFGEFEMGYASAVAYVLFFIIMFITVIQRRLLDRKVD